MPDTARIALALIARNEARSLPAAIESARPYVDEVVVRDTGSRDATLDVARKLGARVVVGSWKDSFAEARNRLLDAVRADWVLMLDADEQLTSGGAELRSLVAAARSVAFNVCVTSPTGFGRSELVSQPRLLRRSSSPRFRYRVYEQLAQDHGCLPDAPLQILHSGFMPSRRLDKCLRNLALLRRDLEDHSADPYLGWRLARELELVGRSSESRAALDATARTLRGLGVDELACLRFAPEAASDWAEAAIERREADSALGLVTRVALAHPARPLALLTQARVLAALGRAQDARSATERLRGFCARHGRRAESVAVARKASQLLQALA